MLYIFFESKFVERLVEMSPSIMCPSMFVDFNVVDGITTREAIHIQLFYLEHLVLVVNVF